MNYLYKPHMRCVLFVTFTYWFYMYRSRLSGDLRSPAEIRGSWTDMYEWFFAFPTQHNILVRCMQKKNEPTSKSFISSSVTHFSHLNEKTTDSHQHGNSCIPLYCLSCIISIKPNLIFDLVQFFQVTWPIRLWKCGQNCFRICFTHTLLLMDSTCRHAHSRGSSTPTENQHWNHLI